MLTSIRRSSLKGSIDQINDVDDLDTLDCVRRKLQSELAERATSAGSCEGLNEESFFVADLGQVFRQHARWRTHLHQVDPFYAVKCNDDDKVLTLLAALGCGFDCASIQEIERILGLGVKPSRIVYANPHRAESAIRTAARLGVKRLVFDSLGELQKVQKLCPDAELILRIFADDPTATYRLGQKYGVSLATAISLLMSAQSMGLSVCGVCFHIGSGSSNPDVYEGAVADAHKLFEEASALGIDMTLLDVGGGFSDENFAAAARVLRRSFEKYFAGRNIRYIAEPGRYLVNKAFTLVCKVIGRRLGESQDAGQPMIYVNDSVFQNFMNAIFETTPQPFVLVDPDRKSRSTPKHDITTVDYIVWGRTCDSTDQISKSTKLRSDVNCGDWLVYGDMGAYTRVLSSPFNGFPSKTEILYVSSVPGISA